MPQPIPKAPSAERAAMILSSGDADMYEGALFSFKGDFVGYLGLEDMGVYTACGAENGSEKKPEELRELGWSIESKHTVGAVRVQNRGFLRSKNGGLRPPSEFGRKLRGEMFLAPKFSWAGQRDSKRT